MGAVDATRVQSIAMAIASVMRLVCIGGPLGGFFAGELLAEVKREAWDIECPETSERARELLFAASQHVKYVLLQAALS